jgi:hypothetical protein
VRIVTAAVCVPWIALTGSLGPASAWNDTGHQVVALVAWENLSPESRGRLVAIMRLAEPTTRLPGLFPRDRREMEIRAREFFRRAATWADLIRDVPELHRATWHHRDFYWKQDKGRAIDLPDVRVHPENLLERLHYFESLLVKPTAPARERAIGLAWLLHLVGDIHQPFHCSARVTAIEKGGDHGGHDFALAPSPQRPRGERYSLHAYWDDMLDRAVPRGPDESLDEYLLRATAVVVSLHPPSQFAAGLKPGQFEAWARESVVVAQSAYPARLRRGGEPPGDYRNSAVRVTLGRLALAGYRLAQMLREITGPVGR